MSKHKISLTLPSDTEIAIERIFDAPLDLVYQAYTDPEALPRWWGPRNLTTVVEQYDVRPGGKWRIVQTAPDGSVHAFRGEFLTVEPYASISQTFEYEPMAGHISEDRATFEYLGMQTKVRTLTIFASKEDRDGMMQSGMETGLSEGYERLDELLAARLEARTAPRSKVGNLDVEVNGTEVAFTRTFNAPRDLVFAAWTQPEHLAAWWGPHGFNVPNSTVDLRVGGAYLVVMRGPDGVDLPVQGQYLEVDPPKKLVMTNDISHMPQDWKDIVAASGVNLDLNLVMTATFDEVAANKTRLTLISHYETISDRDGFLKVGSAGGWEQSFEKLDAHLTQVGAAAVR